MKCWKQVSVFATLSLFAGAAEAQPFIPPAGYIGTTDAPAIAPSPEADAPPLSAIERGALSGRFPISPTYKRATRAHINVIGAYVIQEPKGAHLADIWGRGFMPVFSFGDGRCFTLNADYVGGRLSNAHLARIGCDMKRTPNFPDPAPPSDLSLKRIGTSWGYNAWLDSKSGNTLITPPFQNSFEPLFTAKMPVTAIMAMNSIDSMSGNVTLVGRIDGRLTVVALEVTY